VVFLVIGFSMRGSGCIMWNWSGLDAKIVGGLVVLLMMHWGDDYHIVC